MKFLVVLAVALVAVSAQNQVSQQNQKVWDALRTLRGNKDITAEEAFNLVANAVPGTDYPTNAQIPESDVQCGSYKQPGYYADVSATSRCQAFHRCDENGVRTDYLCGNGSLFNQITLVCDWFYNVDCGASAQFQDYSNSRIQDQNAVLLDNQDVVQITGATGQVQTASASRQSANRARPQPARAGAAGAAARARPATNAGPAARSNVQGSAAAEGSATNAEDQQTGQVSVTQDQDQTQAQP